MRLFRFTLLQSYFIFLKKHKSKALRIINLGIFLSVFAASSAFISFVIEQKISNKQTELINYQIDIRSSNSIISKFEFLMSRYHTEYEIEYTDLSDKYLISETKLLSRIENVHDFYSPYIYINLKDLKYIEELFAEFEMEVDNFRDPIYQELFDIVRNYYGDAEADNYIDNVIEFSEDYKKVKKINFEDYSNKKIPSLADLVDEIIFYEDLHVNISSDIYDDYNDTRMFSRSVLYWIEGLIKVFRALKASEEEEIDKLNNEIIDLSKKEKNIILITFFFQFIIFAIIQIFEVGSISYQFRKLK